MIQTSYGMGKVYANPELLGYCQPPHQGIVAEIPQSRNYQESTKIPDMRLRSPTHLKVAAMEGYFRWTFFLVCYTLVYFTLTQVTLKWLFSLLFHNFLQVYAWGNNTYGQLTHLNSPTTIPRLAKVILIVMNFFSE